MSRSKEIRIGTIPIASHTRKERLDLEVEELARLFISSTGKADGNGRRWLPEDPCPAYINAIKRCVRAAFAFKDEVTDFAITVYPPPPPNSKNMTVIKPADMQVASRIVAVAGSKECIEYVTTQNGDTGKGKVALNNGEAVATKFGIAAGMSIMFTDRPFEKMPPARGGGMEMPIKKSLATRYVVVIDALMSTEYLIKTIAARAEAMDKGDKAKSSAIVQALTKAYAPQIEAEAAAAGAENAPVVSVPQTE